MPESASWKLPRDSRPGRMFAGHQTTVVDQVLQYLEHFLQAVVRMSVVFQKKSSLYPCLTSRCYLRRGHSQVGLEAEVADDSGLLQEFLFLFYLL